MAKNDNTEELKGCSRCPIPTAICLLQQRACLGFNVVITITPREHSHDIPSNPFVAMKIVPQSHYVDSPGAGRELSDWGFFGHTVPHLRQGL